MKNLLVLALLFSAYSHAGDTDWGGNITNIFADGGIVRIKVCNTTPECKDYWIDPTDDFGKALLSISLSAKATQSGVWVQGLGNQPADWPHYGTFKLTAIDHK